MAEPPKAAQVHETLDVHGRLATQITFNDETADFFAESVDLLISESFYLGGLVYARAVTDQGGTCRSDAVDRPQRNHHVLLVRYVYAGNSCHSLSPAPLATLR
jgi:hypothetical protein